MTVTLPGELFADISEESERAHARRLRGDTGEVRLSWVRTGQTDSGHQRWVNPETHEIRYQEHMPGSREEAAAKVPVQTPPPTELARQPQAAPKAQATVTPTQAAGGLRRADPAVVAKAVGRIGLYQSAVAGEGFTDFSQAYNHLAKAVPGLGMDEFKGLMKHLHNERAISTHKINEIQELTPGQRAAALDPEGYDAVFEVRDPAKLVAATQQYLQTKPQPAPAAAAPKPAARLGSDAAKATGEVRLSEGWRTIGAKAGADGKKHGGTPVQIGKGGAIQKGPAGLTGKKPEDLPARAAEAAPEESGQAEAHAFAAQVFGRRLAAADYAAIAGAPAGAKVAVRYDDEKGLVIHVAGDGMRMEHHFSRVGDKIVARLEGFYLDKEKQGQGLGTAVFAGQVHGMKQFAVDRIEMTADKAPGVNGFYTWGRLGVDGPVPRELARALPDALAGAKTVSDLMQRPGGKEWWQKNGESYEGAFSLHDDATSMRVLRAYQEEKGRGKAVRASLEAGANDFTLTAEDEAALDRAWIRVRAESGKAGARLSWGPADPATGEVRLSEESDRSETESASPLVDAIISDGVVAGVTIADEIRRKVRALALKKNFRRPS